MACRIGSATNPVLVIAAAIPQIVLLAQVASPPDAYRQKDYREAQDGTAAECQQKAPFQKITRRSCAMVTNSSAGIATL